VEFVRTPDDRFEDLPGWPYAPHYVDVAAGDGSATRLCVAFVDEGPADAPPVLCMHGEPSPRSGVTGVLTAPSVLL
jgi:haloalkane dehalogenase